MSELNHLSGACLLEVYSGDRCETAIEMTSLNPGTKAIYICQLRMLKFINHKVILQTV